jgi:CRP/FNR family transcriptional regulator, cyclic AMP receptor protein
MNSATLAKCEILKGLSPDERKLLFPLAETESFKTGDRIYLQDTPAEKVYVLDRGSVALKTVLPAGLEISFEVLERKGTPFGWPALVEPYRLITSAVCLESTRVISFKRKALFDLFDHYPILGYKIFKNLCVLVARRLIRTRQLVAGQL